MQLANYASALLKRSSSKLLLINLIIIALISITTLVITQYINTNYTNFSQEPLAGDMRLKASAEFDPQILQQAGALGLNYSKSTELVTVALSANNKYQLVQIKAVADNYPLAGTLVFSDQQNKIARGKVYVEPDLLELLDLSVGSQIKLGTQQLTVAGTIEAMPELGRWFIDIAPSVIITQQDLATTALVAPGSQYSNYLHFTGSSSARSNFTQWQQQNFPELRLQQREAGISFYQKITQRLNNMVNFTSLIVIMIFAFALQILTRHLYSEFLKPIALLKALGASAKQIYALILSWVLSLSIIAVLIANTVAYFILPKLSLNFTAEYLWQSAIVLFASLAIFVWPTLSKLARTSVTKILRAPEQASQGDNSFIELIVFVALIASLWTNDLILLVQFLALMTIAIAASLILYDLLLRLIKRGASTWPRLQLIIMHAINVDRSGFSIIILGLSFSLVLSIISVNKQLYEEWFELNTTDNPNIYLINILPKHKDRLIDFFNKNEITSEKFYPMATGQVIKINERNFPKNYRPLNNTWAPEMPVGNQLVAGEWFDADSDRLEVSVEQEFAKRFNILVGDQIQVAFNNQLITATVANLREVNWQDFRPNFYLVYSKELPVAYSFMTSVQALDKAKFIAGLNQQFPNITSFDMQKLFQKIQEVVGFASNSLLGLSSLLLGAGFWLLLMYFYGLKIIKQAALRLTKIIGLRNNEVQQNLLLEYLFLSVLIIFIALVITITLNKLVLARVFALSAVSLYWPAWLLLFAILPIVLLFTQVLTRR